MIRAILCVFVLAFAVYAIPQGKDCTLQNDCADSETPLCRGVVQDVNGSVIGSKCVECEPFVSASNNGEESLCPPGEFCVRHDFSGIEGYDDGKMGECLDMDLPLGEVCDPAISAFNVIKGENELLYCGMVTRWEDAPLNTARHVQWEGSCVNRVCVECTRGSASASADKGCYTSGVAGIAGSYSQYHAPGSVLDINQNSEAQIMVTITVFVALIFVTQCLLLAKKASS
jgi:hypothetical protein